MKEKAAADWKAFTERLAMKGGDASTISTEQALDELVDKVWADASTLTKAYIKTHWKNTIRGREREGMSAPPATTISAPVKMTLTALNGMDTKDWAGARDWLVAALAVDDQFVPAVMLFRALRLARPSVFKQGDITINEALVRIEGASVKAKERGKRFVESLISSPSLTTSESRMLPWAIGVMI
jgi:hypothetical protein